MPADILTKRYALYYGDCLKLLGEFPSDAAIISDPPYGIDYNHGGGNRFGMVGVTSAAKLRGSPKIHGDNAPFDPSPWLAFPNVVLWGADHFYPRLPDYGRWLAWNKLGDMEPWDSFSDVEFAWHSGEAAARIFSMKWKGIACEKFGENNGQREHPTQKPVRLMAWCIQQARLNPGQVVIDPYMGSGTTGAACLAAGVPFIGCEIDPAFFANASKRLARVARLEHRPLLGEPPSLPKPEAVGRGAHTACDLNSS